jgi:multiple sugar transport system permease protein
LHRFRDITLPLLTPFVIIITMITVIEATNVFDLLLTLTGGGPFYGTEVIDIFIYRQAFTSNIPRLGYASAAALFFGACVAAAAAMQVVVVARLRRSRTIR